SGASTSCFWNPPPVCLRYRTRWGRSPMPSGDSLPFSRVAFRSMDVLDDLAVLHRNQPLGHHLIQKRQEPLNAFGNVYDLDFDGQVGRDVQNGRPVDTAIGPEAFDPLCHGRTCQPFLLGPLDDGVVERLPMPLIRVADIDADEFSRAFDLHAPSPCLLTRHVRASRAAR